MLPLLLAVLAGVEAPDTPVERRGAVPLGLSLSAGLGISERPDTGGVAFTQEAALSLDLPGRFVAQLGLRIARGNEPAFILVNGTAWYRFAFSHTQIVIPHVGAGLVVGAIASAGSTALIVGPSIEATIEFKIARFFGAWVRPAVAFLFGEGVSTVLLHQTAGVTLSL